VKKFLRSEVASETVFHRFAGIDVEWIPHANPELFIYESKGGKHLETIDLTKFGFMALHNMVKDKGFAPRTDVQDKAKKKHFKQHSRKKPEKAAAGKTVMAGDLAPEPKAVPGINKEAAPVNQEDDVNLRQNPIFAEKIHNLQELPQVLPPQPKAVPEFLKEATLLSQEETKIISHPINVERPLSHQVIVPESKLGSLSIPDDTLLPQSKYTEKTHGQTMLVELPGIFLAHQWSIVLVAGSMMLIAFLLCYSPKKKRAQ